MTTLTLDAINNFLAGKPDLIVVDMATKPKLRKTVDTPSGREPNPHFENVTKVTKGMIAFPAAKGEYGNWIRAKLSTEGKNRLDYEQQNRKWGTRIGDSAIIEHKGTYYLEVIVTDAGTSEYHYNGGVIDKAAINGLPKTSEAKQGGLDNKLIVRTIKLESLTNLAVALCDR